MSRIQLALNVDALDTAITFYSKLFGVPPAKVKPGYANFAIAEPPLKLVLIEGAGEDATRLDHLGVEVEDSAQVGHAARRLKESGLATVEENDTACCYAVQDKVWVTGPGGEPWEVYVVKGDADTLAKADDSACCTPRDSGSAGAAVGADCC